MSKPEPKPARYRTTNWSAYNAALTKRGSLLIWLDKEMAWHAPHEGRPGRPPVFSDAAIQFCLSMALLHKSDDYRSSPFPGHTYPRATVTGMPRAVKRFITAARS
ncbi:hypothetical protein CEW88_16135 [Alloyangia pacifica]|uniref:Transposase DDE domain-containing protein n=1 Tax=Alloyangia pacifica TaxID=311180 RepID=A0A2U8HGY9_9RHOB|nr:hypothetical protein CEW88_16135 [Alloyangia pacifica]